MKALNQSNNKKDTQLKDSESLNILSFSGLIKVLTTVNLAMFD